MRCKLRNLQDYNINNYLKNVDFTCYREKINKKKGENYEKATDSGYKRR